MNNNCFKLFILLATICLMDASVLWDGNASRGKSSVWNNQNLEGEGTSIDIVDDSTYGKVWRFHKPKGAHRCEGHGAKGFQAKEGDDIYIGWKLKLEQPQDLTTNANFQWKAYGADMKQNYPIVLKALNGQLALEQYNPEHKKNSVWSTKLETDKWHDIVLHIHVSRDILKGFIEFWYNGKQQKLIGGSEKFVCRTLDAEHCDPKWGVYGGDAGDVTGFVANIKIASTYDDAVTHN